MANASIFFAKNMWVAAALQKLLTFFAAKTSTIFLLQRLLTFLQEKNQCI